MAHTGEELSGGMRGLIPNVRLAFFILLIVMLALAANAKASSANYPVVDKITIYPSSPDKYDDLTCRAEVSDFDGNLDYVKFVWEVNGKLVRQNNRLVYGTSDSAEDILSSRFTQPGDAVVCKAWVYDFDDYYDYDYHAVHVGRQNQNKPPSSSYVEITPRHPNPQQDLTCSILAMDADDNLDYVNFEWFVNSEKVRTGKKYVYGSSDTAEDLLSSYYTQDGDYVECRVTVFDTQGESDSEYSQPVYVEDGVTPPPYPNKKPIPVFTTGNRHVDTDVYVYFSGVASYDPDGFVIQYYFDFGDGSHSPWLPRSSPYTYHAYSEPGVYYAKLKVKDNKYLESDWSGEIAIYVSEGGYYGNPPHVDRVNIEPENPDKYDDLRCEARLKDSDGDLDYVRFQWYVNGYLEESRTANVYGSSDEVSDLLDYYNFERGDAVKCRVTVYDRTGRSDTDYDAVTIGNGYYEEEEPGIESIQIEPDNPDVYDDLTCEVRVEDNNGDLDYVWFQWFVNGDEAREVKKNVYGYHDIVSFDLDSRYYDYDDLVKCKATVYDEDGNRNSDYDYVRIGEYPPGEGCAISVESFDYSTYVLEGSKSWVETTVKNTGSRSSTLTLNLFADGSLKDTYSVYLVRGREITKKFEFGLPLGSHDIRLESYLACSSPVNKNAEIFVYKSGGHVIIPEEEEQAEEITETSVLISPNHLDVEIYTGKTIEILIESPEKQTFNIEVLDLPNDWANYPKRVDVEGRERVYVYIVPKLLGEYTFRIRVTTGEKTFQESVDMYVAPEGELTEDVGLGGKLTGFITAGGAWIAGLIFLVIVIIILVLYVLNKKYRHKTYQEHVYSGRKPPATVPPAPQTNVMKGSVGRVPENEEVDIDRLIPAEINRYSDLSYFPKNGDDFSENQKRRPLNSRDK